jgi:predicted dehydrogenase
MNTLNRKNVAFVGIGKHALEHLIPSLMVTPGMNFYTAYSRSKEKLLKIKELYNVETVAQSLDDILNDPKVDIVAVSGSPSFHYSIALSALKKGKHVFIEKPPATNKKELLNLLKYAKLNNVSIVVGYNFSRGTRLYEVKTKIGTNLIKHIDITYTSKRPRELQYHYKDLVENGLYVLAIHAFHTLIEEFGEVEKLSTLFSPFDKNLYKIEHFFKLKSGKTATLSWGNYYNKFIFNITLIDIKGNNYSILSMRDLLFSSSKLDKDKGSVFRPLSAGDSNYSLTGYQENWNILRESINSGELYLKDLKNSIYIFDIFSIILKDLNFSKKPNLLEHNISKLKLMK